MNLGRMVFLFFIVIIEVIADASIIGQPNYQTTAGSDAFGVLILLEIIFSGVLLWKALGD